MSSLPFAQMQRRGGFNADLRFLSGLAPQPEHMVDLPTADPLSEAFEQGFNEGIAAAQAELTLQQAERDAAREAIELALYRMDRQGAVEMAERLRQTVLALCEQAVLPLAVEPAGLAARIARAVAMLQRAQDEKRVLLHPEDLALVASLLPAGLLVEADPSVERGALRIETPDGGVEDGPSQWRRILAEAFHEC